MDERREEILEQMDAVENVVERGLVEDKRARTDRIRTTMPVVSYNDRKQKKWE